MTARFVLERGSANHRAFVAGCWVVGVMTVVIIGFAFVDVGQITLGSNSYNLSLIRLNKAIAFMVAILGLQVVVGYTGQVALGQSFFVGIGAYMSAYLIGERAWSYPVVLAVVVAVCFAAGVVSGVPALRIRGLYLALVTLGMAATFPAIVQLDQLHSITNGASGRQLSGRIAAPSWAPLDQIATTLQRLPLLGQYFGDGPLAVREADRLWRYLIFAVVAFVCFVLVRNLVESRQGRALRAIRDNETSAAASGVHLALHKSIAFGVASALGGVAGLIYVAELGIASPNDFTQLLAINLVVGLVVGGAGTLAGAVVGGLVIALVPDWTASTTSLGPVPERWLGGPTGALLLGVALIVLVFVSPGGAAAGLRRLARRIVEVEPRSSATPDRPADGDLAVITPPATTPSTTTPPIHQNHDHHQ